MISLTAASAEHAAGWAGPRNTAFVTQKRSKVSSRRGVCGLALGGAGLPAGAEPLPAGTAGLSRRGPTRAGKDRAALADAAVGGAGSRHSGPGAFLFPSGPPSPAKPPGSASLPAGLAHSFHSSPGVVRPWRSGRARLAGGTRVEPGAVVQRPRNPGRHKGLDARTGSLSALSPSLPNNSL